MSESNGRIITDETKSVEQHLKAMYPNTEAYRYNIASIRVRVIDESFRGKSEVEREELVDPLLQQLPEETQSDITILLLLAPGEESASMMNIEFEHPSPTSLVERC